MIAAYQTVKVVSRRSGLSGHVIRIWERRYGAVEPERAGISSNSAIGERRVSCQLGEFV